MAKRIYKDIILVALIVLITAGAFIVRQIYIDFLDKQIEELKVETNLFAYGVSKDGISFLDGFKEYNDRITLIDVDGTVLFDNSESIDRMDNHLDRQEVKDAFERGYGVSTRYSSTLMETFVYSAIKLDNGSIIRLSSKYNSIFAAIIKTFKPLMIVVILLLITSMLLAKRITKKIIDPLNTIDLDKPDSKDCYKEIQPFMEKISLQQNEINENMISLERRKQEFETITENMNEGMVLLNSKGIILEINKFASNILSIDEKDIGKKINECKYNNILTEILDNALINKSYHKKATINNISYDIETSLVSANEGITGILLLIFDNSYKEANEKLRKEFSSNVSHELKTPLQTISGYAELLKSGLIKQDDQSEVADHIYVESQRMISLINDIIKLSHLDDEETNVTMELIDIYTISKNVLENLIPEANKNNIKLHFEGSNNLIKANAQLVESIVFNLVDNAIKYNKTNGDVFVTVSNTKDKVVLKVKDTGIGIAKDNYKRIFERFYQIDKAKSKLVGGTGLGLSIVKHALILNDASIDIESEEGIGTTFTVLFNRID